MVVEQSQGHETSLITVWKLLLVHTLDLYLYLHQVFSTPTFPPGDLIWDQP